MAEAPILAAALARSHPDEAAAILDTFGPAQSAAFLAALDAEAGTPVLRAMSMPQASASLGSMATPSAVALLRGMPPSAAAALLRSIPAARRGELLRAMSRSRQIQIGLVLRQPQLSVGAWMDSSVIPVRIGATVGDAKQLLQQAPTEAAYLFVVEDGQVFRGRVAVAALLRAADDVGIERLYEAESPSVRASAEIEAAVSAPVWEGHDELPVLDRDGRFVGAIRYVALRQALARSNAREIEDIRPPGASLMELADLWYIGMAKILDTSIGRRYGPPEKKDGAAP